jgi:hypothetical protein
VVVAALCTGVHAAAASAAKVVHYRAPIPWAGTLLERSLSGGAGTGKHDWPGPHPWDLPAADYCTAYKFRQPGNPQTSAPLSIPSDVAIGDLTGFDPGAPRERYQVRHTGQADSSTCQARGRTWGFWINANTDDNGCAHWCGIRHDYSTGLGIGTRPWSDAFGPQAQLVLSSYRSVRRYAGRAGWGYVCAMLQDQSTWQRLEYCLRVWRSWPGAPVDRPLVFFDPALRTGFASITSDLTPEGTRYATGWRGAVTVVGPQADGRRFGGAISREQLLGAVDDLNARVRRDNLGACGGRLSGVRCYSRSPGDYSLLGLEDGLELAGTGTAQLGGFSRGLRAFTAF